jgi:WD40 repeat protein
MKHEGKVYSARFSPDGQRIVTDSKDKTARVWDAATGKAISQPMKHEDQVCFAQFSPDGQRVVTVSADSENEANSDIPDSFWWMKQIA